MPEIPVPAETKASEYPEWLLKVTDLKQFAYCPRIPYYHYCLPAVRPTTYKMDAGIRAQDRAEELERRRSLRAYGLTEGERHFNVSIASGQLGVSGQIDLVIRHTVNGEERLIPVDYKLSRREPGRHFKLQLACYALLLEEAWQLPVEDGFLYLIPARKAVRVPVTTRLRNDVRRQLAEIRELVLAERMPAVSARQRSRCVDCEFRRFCNDML
ncbi:MAG: CRISPR-associated protein Cas4 [Caldilineaceae bacterium]|nr:CRISPR-associated protein Cas4 [Caldilineaceae bacterium]MDE0338427.1 CRISPR-associated protein Cas4 [Caldilineaceae bacterium]